MTNIDEQLLGAVRLAQKTVALQEAVKYRDGDVFLGTDEVLVAADEFLDWLEK